LGFLDGNQETESKQARKKEELKINKQGNTQLVPTHPVPSSSACEATSYEAS